MVTRSILFYPSVGDRCQKLHADEHYPQVKPAASFSSATCSVSLSYFGSCMHTLHACGILHAACRFCQMVYGGRVSGEEPSECNVDNCTQVLHAP